MQQMAVSRRLSIYRILKESVVLKANFDRATGDRGRYPTLRVG
jgi:hypothetical protein